MAESLIARAFKWRGPNKAVVIEEPDARPAVDEIVSRSGEAFTIPTTWLNAIALNDDNILPRGGGLGLKLYDDLLDDDVAMSSFQQRRLRVISRPWEVEAGDDKDPRSVEAAEHLRQNLKSIGWDRITNAMLFGVWYGYAVAEGLIEVGADGKYRLADVVVPDRRWFGFTNEGQLRFKPGFSMTGEELPPNRFWVMRTGASHDFAFYGLGLAHWCYWPIWFKRNMIKFWALYLEKMGRPTVVGQVQDNWSAAEKSSFLKTLISIGKDSAVSVPEGALKDNGITMMEATRGNSGNSGYAEFTTEQNEALMRVINGQPGTSKAVASGLNGNTADVHEDVAKMIAQADADLVCESFNQTFPVWLTRWNFGDDVAPPRVYRVMDDADDVDTIADRDVKLDGIGIKRTDESITEVYGPGYERAEVPTQLKNVPQAVPGLQPQAASNDDEDGRDAARNAFAAQDEAPLYVYRAVKTPAALVRWAKANGIPNITPANELHTTVLYSRKPVDWFELSDGWSYDSTLKVPEGGARKVERFDGGAIVLRFASDDLKWSHQRKIERGASHDYPEYLPHITIGYDPDGTLDLDKVVPFIGELNFGPEIFEALEVDRLPGIEAMDFAAADEDAIDRIADMLADETNPLVLEFGASLQRALEGITSPEAARVALLEAFERMPADQMARLAGLPLIYERMAGAAGIDE